MGVEFGVIRNASIEEVRTKKRNLYLGISLNNKWFTKENMKEVIIWGIEHTKDKFGIVIADMLQAINYEVQSKYSKAASERKAVKEGDKVLKIINEILRELPLEKQKKVDVIRWNQIREDQFYKEAETIILEEFEKNIEFRNKIKEIVKEFIVRLNKKLDEKQLENLCLYVIDELPELINGFNYDGIKYDCHFYPFDGTLTQLVESIQKREIFEKLRDKLPMKDRGNGFLEIRHI